MTGGGGLPEVSLARLHVLRAAYLLVAVGLFVYVWPHLLDQPPDLEHPRGVMWSLLGAVGLLALLGLRYPLRMLPLLLFELTWKTIWIVAIGLPRWRAGSLGPAESATWFDCLFGVVVCVLVIPWGFVVRRYLVESGDPWRRA